MISNGLCVYLVLYVERGNQIAISSHPAEDSEAVKRMPGFLRWVRPGEFADWTNPTAEEKRRINDEFERFTVPHE